MDSRTDFILQIIESIGLPLVEAVEDSSKQHDAAQAAEIIGTLLSGSTAFGSEIGKALDFKGDDLVKSSVRANLAAIAAQIIATQYKRHNKVPGDTENKRVITALESVLTFSDNFTPDVDSIARMKSLSEDYALFDTQQINISYVLALLPALNAVGGFSFGQSESKLLQDITDKLGQRAQNLRRVLFAEELEVNEAKLLELSLLRMLVRLYSDCHKEETDRIMKLDEAARSSITIDSVWSAFEKRAQMLETLATSFVPAKGTVSGATSQAPAATEQAAASQPAAESPPAQPITETPPVAAATEAAAAPTEAPASPVGQVIQSSTQEQAPAAPAAPAETAQAAPPSEQAPAAPASPIGQVVQKAEQETPAQPPVQEEQPADNTAANENSDGDDGEQATGTGGNPMSFFKQN